MVLTTTLIRSITTFNLALVFERQEGGLLETSISVEEFLQQGIRDLVAGKETLRAVFVTYNNFDPRYAPSGDIGEGLSVRIMAGGIESSALADSSIRKLADELLQSPDEPDLLVVYVGRRAWEVAAKSIKRVHERWPKVTVLLVTCDCFFQEKWTVFGPLVESGVVYRLLSTRDCGGGQALKQILDGLVSAWNAR